MPTKGKKSKGKKTLKIFLLVFILLILIIFLGINNYLENIIKDKVDTQLNNNPHSLYQVSYNDLDLNILSGSVSVKSILIQPSDSATMMVNNGLLGSFINMEIEQFKIKHLKIFDFISDKNVDISKVILKNVNVKYIVNPDAEKHKIEKTGNSNEIFPDVLNKVYIADFEFLNTTFQMANYKQPNDYLFEIDSLSITVANIFMDDKTIKNTIPIDFSSIEINTQLFSTKSMKYYSISTSGIGFNAKDTTLTLNAFKLTPKYNRDEFNKKIKYNDDLFSISTEKIVLNSLDLNKIKHSKLINFKSVIVYKPIISIYRDKRLPDAPFKKKKLITSMVMSIPVSIDIDSLKVLDGKLTYEEMHKSVDQPGKVFFDPLFLTVYNVTNDSTLINQNAHLQIDVLGKIMGKSDMTANFDFHLNRTDDYFTAKGKLKAISGIEFNQMLASLLLAEVQSGDVHSATFNFSANDDSSNGTLDLVYDNLVVNLLKQKDPDKKSKALSWLAGNFVDKSNLPGDPKYRKGIIHFDRNKDKAIVNYLWNSVKTGIVTSIVPFVEKKKIKKEKKEEKKTEKEMDKEKKRNAKKLKKKSR